MKKALLLFLPLLACSFTTIAQQPFNTIEYIDINNIKAGHLVHGDMWYHPTTGVPLCEYPKGSGKNVAFLGSLWISGVDLQGNLLAATQEYRQQGNDYFPGPIDTSIHGATATYQQSSSWAKIWKISRATIDSFRLQSNHTLANTPTAILQWPGKGNLHAAGANQTALTINRDMAPFVDVDGDGLYNPLNGDYPKMKGDQMLWYIFNDAMQPKTNTQSPAIGLEIQQSVYAYHRNSSLDNIVFYEYSIKNALTVSLSNVRVGLNIDPDLGDGFDDYIGFDSTRRMGYVYNAKSPDGQGQANSYGSDIPAAGFSIMEFPGDVYSTLQPAGAFVPYYQNGINGNPSGALEYHRLLNGYNRSGTHVQNDMALGNASTGFGTGPLTNYAFPGDPGNSSEWSQCQNGLPKNEDRKFVVSSPSFTFLYGDTRKIGFALIVSPHAGACPTVNLSGLRSLSDTALITYYNPPASLGVHNLSTAKTLKVYPNPATDLVHILAPDAAQGIVSVFDATGKKLALQSSANGNTITIETNQFAKGMYIIEYRSAQTVANNTFIKL